MKGAKIVMDNAGLRVTCIGSDSLERLSSEARQCIDEYMSLKAEFVISDSGAFSELMQRYLNENKYRNVKIVVVEWNFINRLSVNNLGNWEEVHFYTSVPHRCKDMTEKIQRLKYKYLFYNSDEIIAVWVNGDYDYPKYRDLYIVKNEKSIHEFFVSQKTQDELDEAYYEENCMKWIVENAKEQSKRLKKIRRNEVRRLFKVGHFF